jgi:hypothetical protein
MKTPALIASILFLPLSFGFGADKENVIVDTNFSQWDAEGAPDLSPEPCDPAELPLKNPTFLKAQPPTSLTLGTETMGTMQTPYLLVKFAKEAEGEGIAGWNGGWKVEELHLSEGKFEVSFQVTPMDEEFFGPIVIVQLTGKGGTPQGSMHPTQVPLQIAFSEGKIAFGSAGSAPYSQGATYAIKMTFDLQEKTWGASVDGADIFQDERFPDAMIDSGQSFEIHQLAMNVGGRPDASVGIANMKLAQILPAKAP